MTLAPEGSNLGDLPVASRWWMREQVAHGLTRLWEPHVDPLLRCSVWHIRGSERDLLVDSGMGIVSLTKAFPDLFDRDLIAVATHSHNDHVGGMHEFTDVWIHGEEADNLAHTQQGRGVSLVSTDFPAGERDYLRSAGYRVPDLLITALPYPGFDPRSYRVRPCAVAGSLAETQMIDLGDRRYRVLHTPGHTPGSVSLVNVDGSEVFTGDALYDGPLLAGLEESDEGAYIDTILRLRSLNVAMVHPGHERSFDAARRTELCDKFLAAHPAGATSA